MSETAKYRHLTTSYCAGNGLDIASAGDPVVPHAIQLELPEDQFETYNSGHHPASPVQWRGDCRDLPFKSNTLDFVYSSHLLEDFLDWKPLLQEWVRVLKPGGNLVILLPDQELWAAALAAGQPPNCAHRHEAQVGELSTYATDLGLRVIADRRTACAPGDYSILFVAAKV